MVREIVIALAWLMDHPKKELGSLLALGGFVVMIVVAFVKNKNQVSRYRRLNVEYDRKKRED